MAFGLGRLSPRRRLFAVGLAGLLAAVVIVVAVVVAQSGGAGAGAPLGAGRPATRPRTVPGRCCSSPGTAGTPGR